MHKNIETVKQVYAAFGAGDVPKILSLLNPDVSWDGESSTGEVPWLAPRRGREGVGLFFKSVYEDLDIQHFAVKTILGDGDVVVALVDINAVVKRTGKRFAEVDEAHVFRFDPQGQVVRFRHCVDSHNHWLASR